MINPNETKSVFWLIIFLVAVFVLFHGYCYYKGKKDNVIAPAPDPEPAPAETEEEVE